MKTEVYTARCHVCTFERTYFDAQPTRAHNAIVAHQKRAENDPQHKGAEVVSLPAHRSEILLIPREKQVA